MRPLSNFRSRIIGVPGDPTLLPLLIALGVLATYVSPAAGQNGYCAFEVKVSEPLGSPVDKVPVLMFLRNGSVFVEATTSSNGVARLCDAPLEAVDIGVGFDMCGSTMVRDVRATWPNVRRIFVTYERSFCNHFVLRDHCQVLVRIKDEEGRPVAGARFEGKPFRGSRSEVSDAFGRLFFLNKLGEKLEGSVVKDGRKSDYVFEKCGEQDDRDAELSVVWKKQ